MGLITYFFTVTLLKGPCRLPTEQIDDSQTVFADARRRRSFQMAISGSRRWNDAWRRQKATHPTNLPAESRSL